MFRKHLLLTISLTALVCLHSICPLYCAAIEQISCGTNLIQNESNKIQSSSSCCHRNETDTSGENDNTSEDGDTCCLTSFEVILTDFTYRLDYTPKSVEYLTFTNVSIDSSVKFGQEQQHNISIPPKLSLISLTYNISHRGPPYILT